MSNNELINKDDLLEELLKIPGVGSNSIAIETIERFKSEKPNKAVIPHFVASEIGTYVAARLKEDLVRDICLAFQGYPCGTPYESDVVDWCHKGDNLRLVIDAIWNGYEVEKEPLYYVKLPIWEWNYKESALRNQDMYLGYGVTSDETRIFRNVTRVTGYEFELTESQIREFDERYWAFAVPVEEESNC